MKTGSGPGEQVTDLALRYTGDSLRFYLLSKVNCKAEAQIMFTLVCPSSSQSATSHTFSEENPVTLEERRPLEGLKQTKTHFQNLHSKKKKFYSSGISEIRIKQNPNKQTNKKQRGLPPASRRSKKLRCKKRTRSNFSSLWWEQSVLAMVMFDSIDL